MWQWRNHVEMPMLIVIYLSRHPDCCNLAFQLMQSIFSTPPRADLQGGQHGTSNISLDAQVCIGCTIDPEPF